MRRIRSWRGFYYFFSFKVHVFCSKLYIYSSPWQEGGEDRAGKWFFPRKLCFFLSCSMGGGVNPQTPSLAYCFDYMQHEKGVIDYTGNRFTPIIHLHPRIGLMNQICYSFITTLYYFKSLNISTVQYQSIEILYTPRRHIFRICDGP